MDLIPSAIKVRNKLMKKYQEEYLPEEEGMIERDMGLTLEQYVANKYDEVDEYDFNVKVHITLSEDSFEADEFIEAWLKENDSKFI